MMRKRQITLGFFVLAFSALAWFAAWQIHLGPVRSRSLLFAFILLGAMSLAGLFILTRSARLRQNILSLIDARQKIILVGSLLTLAAAWLLYALTVNAQSGWPLALQPAITWLANLGILAVFTLFSLSQAQEDASKIILPVLVIFGALALLAAFMAASGLGLERIGYYWYAPGTPLLISQVLIALLAGGGLHILFSSHWGQRIPLIRKDWFVALALFALTATAWLNEPMKQPVNFLPVALPPSYQVFPDSDSAYLDINAQRLLTGQPLSVDPADKPTYSFFLYLLHLLAGQNYPLLINLQVIVLAVIPAIFYLFFAVGFSNRPAGLAAGLLFMMREINSIQLSNIILVSHPKLMLSDVPSAGLMILLALLLLGWAREPSRRPTWPLWMGIVFAAFLLLRTQVLLLAPLVILGFLLTLRHEPRQKMFLAVGLLALGFAAFSLPWTIYGLGAPPSANASAYTRQLGIQFQLDPLNHNVRPQAWESEHQFNTRIREQVLGFIRENPAYTIKAISAYFFRNLGQGLLFLPASFRLEGDTAGYTSRLPFWEGWTGGIPPEARGIFTLNLLLVAVGLAAAWKKIGLPGLLPLALYLGYLASLSIPMISGWRFLLPADWIVLAYYVLGATTLAEIFWQRRDPCQPAALPGSAEPSQVKLSWKKVALIVGLTASASASLFAIDASTPPRYPEKTEAQLLAEFTALQPQLPEIPGEQAVNAFLNQENAVLLTGRALYPRFFEADEGFSGNGIVSYRPYDFPRLGFYLLGTSNKNILLPLAQSPGSFPHAADAWVLGCQREADYFHRTYVEALLVAIPQEKQTFWRYNTVSLDCGE